MKKLFSKLKRFCFKTVKQCGGKFRIKNLLISTLLLNNDAVFLDCLHEKNAFTNNHAGAAVGDVVGSAVGLFVGTTVGIGVGDGDGRVDGCCDG